VDCARAGAATSAMVANTAPAVLVNMRDLPTHARL
jgi:hypothetical protein